MNTNFFFHFDSLGFTLKPEFLFIYLVGLAIGVLGLITNLILMSGRGQKIFDNVVKGITIIAGSSVSYVNGKAILNEFYKSDNNNNNNNNNKSDDNANKSQDNQNKSN